MDRQFLVQIVVAFTLVATIVFSFIGAITQDVVILYILITVLATSGLALLIYGIKQKSLVVLPAICFLLASWLIFRLASSL